MENNDQEFASIETVLNKVMSMLLVAIAATSRVSTCRLSCTHFTLSNVHCSPDKINIHQNDILSL